MYTYSIVRPVSALAGHLLAFPEFRLGLYEVLWELWPSIGGISPLHPKIFLVDPHLRYESICDMDELCLCHRLARCRRIIKALVKYLDVTLEISLWVLCQAEALFIHRNICNRYAGVVLVEILQ